MHARHFLPLLAAAAAAEEPLIKEARQIVEDDTHRQLQQGLAPEVTERVFFDLSIGGESAGRVTLGLYGGVCPRTVANSPRRSWLRRRAQRGFRRCRRRSRRRSN